ncbi:hypothetical protein BH20ACT9_BH20ACT9_03050 [soil metagenome]
MAERTAFDEHGSSEPSPRGKEAVFRAKIGGMSC